MGRYRAGERYELARRRFDRFARVGPLGVEFFGLELAHSHELDHELRVQLSQ